MLNRTFTRRDFAGLMLAAGTCARAAAETGEWTELFDGRTLNGWKPSEHKASWKVVDGMLAADGPRSHLFYVGNVHGADFRNFELEVEVITKPLCNSGVYFHTVYQESGFPEKGFEIQINNTAKGDGGYLERKKTGSLYGLRNMYKQLVPDEKPFRINTAVRGKNVQIRLNGELLVDYVEPTPPVIPAGGEKQRFLDHGTFALQCHNDGSQAFFRSVRVRPLPDSLPAYTSTPPVVDEVYREIIDIGRHNVPMIDYQVNLGSGLTLEQALRKSRADGIQYGIATEAGALKSDADVHKCLRPLNGKPVFFTLAASNGSWTGRVSQNRAQQFDLVVADGSADTGIEQTLKRLDTEPIDIYRFGRGTQEFWTPQGRSRLIESLVGNKVAIELNSLDQSPKQDFILAAKQAGCKFGFGTGNKTAAELKRSEYGLQMVEACKLDWHNFFAPSAWWPKATERRWPNRA
jgi:hypothetical protein